MPILPAEPDLYPDDLFLMDDARLDRILGDDRERWLCLHTRPRREKVVARMLRKKQIMHYLPQIVRVSRTPGGRKFHSVLPMFPSYLFMRGDETQRVEALRGNHLANILEVPDQAELVRDLRQIHQVLDSGLEVQPDTTYPIGTLVRILNGPLTGLVGTVQNRGKRDHFTAIVHFLGKGARVELEDWQVERINPLDVRNPPAA